MHKKQKITPSICNGEFIKRVLQPHGLRGRLQKLADVTVVQIDGVQVAQDIGRVADRHSPCRDVERGNGAAEEQDADDAHVDAAFAATDNDADAAAEALSSL